MDGVKQTCRTLIANYWPRIAAFARARFIGTNFIISASTQIAGKGNEHDEGDAWERSALSRIGQRETGLPETDGEEEKEKGASYSYSSVSVVAA